MSNGLYVVPNALGAGPALRVQIAGGLLATC